MLLNKLGNEKKKLFLQLVKKVMEADGFVSDDEKAVYNSFCAELDIHLTDDEKVNDKTNLEEIISALSEICTKAEKRLIAFEIITIAIADKELNENENEIINKFCKKIGIDDADKENMFFYAQNLLLIQEDIIHLIEK